MIKMDDYLHDVGPGRGRRRAPRAWLHSDAPTLSLASDWRFRLLAGVPGSPGGAHALPAGEESDAMAASDYDDSGWDLLPVPSHWVLHGDGRYGSPLYTNVSLPFPQDPPFAPDENPTGDHRRVFSLPARWLDCEAYEAIVLRFDGVESRYRVWINGTEIGVGTGSRLAQEFDVTTAVREGDNTIAVRVHQWSASTYVEDQDQWWLPGIFRDVALQARPVGGIEDLWVRASFDHLTGAGTVDTEVVASAAAFPVRLEVPDLSISVVWDGPSDVAPVPIASVEAWTAETPRLYDATIMSAGGAERISLRLGFRSIEIVGDRFLVNGRRVVLHGMNRHDTHPDLGRGFDEDFVRRDFALMKRHNVNAIRTAHYPPHPRVLDLADEYGFWVMLECDLETHLFHHGVSMFESGTDEWRDNPSDDPRWRATFLDRIERTVERDKNHPSIVMWSLGNESGTGANLAAMSAWVHERDPERPVHYEGDRAGAYTDVYSRMYPSIAEVTAIGSEATSLLLGASGAESARLRTKPFVLCEYVHAMGNGPGGIDRYEALVDTYPRLHGGFVWEWRDHGVRTKTADGVEFFGYGGDFGETAPHDAHTCMDGMVLSDGTPTPGLVEFAAVTAPLRFDARTTADGIVVEVRNTRHSAHTGDLVFPWRVERDGVEVLAGWLNVAMPDGAPLAAGDAVVVLQPLAVDSLASGGGELWFTVSAVLADSTSWAAAGHVVAAHQIPLAGPRAASGHSPRRRSDPDAGLDPLCGFGLGPARFEHGRLVSLAGAPVTGPRLELWRAPTDNDAGSHMGSYDVSDPLDGRGLGLPGPSYAALWRAAGLDRLRCRTLELRRSRSTFHRLTRWAAADSREAMVVDERWEESEHGATVRLDILPTVGWTLVLPRIGVRFDLPLETEYAEWFGTGPGESYPDSDHGALVGRYRSSVEDMSFPYARPQESGHRAALRRLELASAGEGWLRIDTDADAAGRRPGFALARHTPQQIAAAPHQHELPPAVATYLHLDAGQNGLGSRACGPDVWPDHLLRPEARSLVFHISAM